MTAARNLFLSIRVRGVLWGWGLGKCEMERTNWGWVFWVPILVGLGGGVGFLALDFDLFGGWDSE